MTSVAVVRKPVVRKPVVGTSAMGMSAMGLLVVGIPLGTMDTRTDNDVAQNQAANVQRFVLAAVVQNQAVAMNSSCWL